MERAIVHSDLTKDEIQPQLLLERYFELLNLDINRFFPEESLQKDFCPVTGEGAVKGDFIKMEMQYNISHTFGNIYLSPRPTIEELKRFYHESEARKFWLTELWPQTQATRQDKIILPQLEWADGFIAQYSHNKEMKLVEYYPNHWGYFNSAKEIFKQAKYSLFEPLFDQEVASISLQILDITENVTEASMDAVFLFEALDRSVEPFELLRKASDSLKQGGLCFITSLLSSGFEVQLLGEKSEIFVPPERMNIFSYEGMNALIEKLGGFEILEFSTPGVLDIPNVVNRLADLNCSAFFKYIFNERQDSEIINSFQDYLQMNRLGTFGRLVLRKQ
jgi:hypothetical protein